MSWTTHELDDAQRLEHARHNFLSARAALEEAREELLRAHVETNRLRRPH